MRKHAGLMLPAPLQAAMVAALGDDAHVAEQKERYRARRDLLKPALEAAGFRIDRSEAGLYLWATEGRDAWDSIARLADLGILAGPGHFYGVHYPEHVRLSLTATDERIAAAAERLRALCRVRPDAASLCPICPRNGSDGLGGCDSVLGAPSRLYSGLDAAPAPGPESR